MSAERERAIAIAEETPGGASAVRIFPHFLFRTTALPFDTLEALGCPAAARLAARVLQTEAVRDEHAEGFLARVRRHAADHTATPALSAAAHRVRRRRILGPDRIAAVRASGHADEADRLDAYEACAREAEAVQAALSGLERFLAEPSARPALERRALRYVQRLCAKNDTISFFGPMTWGRFDAGAERGLDLSWRGTGLTSRHVFFEHWTADRLARAMERDRGLRGSLTFRVRYPFEWSPEGLLLHHALGGRMRRPLPPPSEALLGAFAAGLAAAEALASTGAEAALDALLDAGQVEAFAVPIEALHPVQDLLADLQRTADSAARQIWETRLVELLELKQRFAAAKVEERKALLAAIEERFTAWTGAAPQRNGGRTYGGRNLLYEDCTRHPERFAIGGRVLADLQADLDSLIEVQSALLEIVEPYGWRRLEEVHGAMARGGRAVPLAKFLLKVFGMAGESYLQARFVADEDKQSLLDQAHAALEIRRDAPDRLWVAARDRGAVARARMLRRPVIPGVDLMIAARDAAAAERGDYRFVVGEVQYFPLGYPEYLFVFHPEPARFRADYMRVLADPRAVSLPLLRVELEEEVTRLVRIGDPLADYVLLDGRGRSYDARRPQRRMTELTVELDQGRVVAVDPSGERFLLGNPHHDLFMDAAFKLLVEMLRRQAGRDRTAEMTVGRRTVLVRRQWTVAGEALRPAGAADGGAQDQWSRAPFPAFLAAQRTRRAHGLPRYVFARLPDEVKPVLVDFDSPQLVENLARMARAGQNVVLSEMRPGPDELWLASPEGRHTSELRILLG
jgi:hypothetical protein